MIDASGMRAGLVEWHNLVCGPAPDTGREICFLDSRIRPELGRGTVDLVAFDDDFIVLGLRGRFHESLHYQCRGDGWTRFHFRKAARTLMDFEGIGASELEGPLCQILHQPEGIGDREWIEGRASLDWVTVFMRPHLLVERFRLDSIRLTDPVRRLACGSDEFLLENWALATDMALAMDQLLGHAYAGDLRRLHLEAKALELVCMMSRVLDRRSDRDGAVRLRPRDVEALYEVRRILTGSAAERPSIAALSRRVGINRNKLAYGFRRLFDQTISGFCIESRLQSAWNLVRDTSLPIAVIAGQVGYAQASAFATAFRQRFGCTPRQARAGRLGPASPQKVTPAQE
ncbi:MAG: helix-turn-helix transcriptional regulator [Gammaproteobacteria bacterium]|nr:helix-turn-helix transcriptional regulator [Gammaproteobacteria bacterium]